MIARLLLGTICVIVVLIEATHAGTAISPKNTDGAVDKLKANSKEILLRLNRTLEKELRQNKFYARGETNIHNSPLSKWGPARDVSYFLYDLQPFDEERCDSRRRTRRKGKKLMTCSKSVARAKDTCSKEKSSSKCKQKHTESKAKQEEGDYEEEREKEEDEENECKDDKQQEDEECDSEREIDNEGKDEEESFSSVTSTWDKKRSVNKRKASLWSEWGSWTPCSKSCGEGTSSRWRQCVGKLCPKGEKQAQVKSCSLKPC